MMSKYNIEVPHDWKNELSKKLTDDFIEYQYNLDFPVDAHLKTFDDKLDYFRKNWVAQNKVKLLVSQVMKRVNETIG